MISIESIQDLTGFLETCQVCPVTMERLLTLEEVMEEEITSLNKMVEQK